MLKPVPRKFEPIDYNEYIARKQAARPLTDEEIDRALLSQDLSASLGPRPDTSTTSSTNLIPPSSQSQSQAQPAASSDAQLPYPATFAEIVELIKSGKPIPGKILPFLFLPLSSCRSQKA